MNENGGEVKVQPVESGEKEKPKVPTKFTFAKPKVVPPRVEEQTPSMEGPSIPEEGVAGCPAHGEAPGAGAPPGSELTQPAPEVPAGGGGPVGNSASNNDIDPDFSGELGIHNPDEPEPLTPDGGEEGTEEIEEFVRPSDFSSYQEVQCCNWGAEYLKCQIFARIYRDTQDPTKEWPKGIKFLQGRLYLWDKLCVPLTLQKAWVRELHAYNGHVGADRLWSHMVKMYEFALEEEALEFTQKVSGQCETCQANVRTKKVGGTPGTHSGSTPLMTHVSLDLFFMDKVKDRTQIFDTMAVCVDRHWGWIIAVPCQN